MKVIKFGGSSIATPERVRLVSELVKSGLDATCPIRAVVFSAFGGVTDDLIALSTKAAEGDDSYKNDLASVLKRQTDALIELVPSSRQSATQMQIKLWSNDLEDVLNGVFLVGELSHRCLDFIMSFGELFSSYIIAQSLGGDVDQVEFLDARCVIKTNDCFGNGVVDMQESARLIKQHFDRHPGLQVVTGFIASTKNNDTITLGRGGSDYTAAIMASALDAESIEIWTDVDGLMTADPRKVPKAFSQPVVSYSEAMELSHFGAKVIYPPTMQPALDKQIPIIIKNTLNPQFEGTEVLEQNESATGMITGISSIESISLLRVQGSGMVGVAGISSRLFGALARETISVILITQASSEHTICFAVKPEFSEAAANCLREEFALEMASKVIDDIFIEHELSILSVVGENMRQAPGVASKVFGALGSNGVNIVAIAQGSSELNISCVVQRKNEVKALRALHEEFFFPDRKALHLFLVGPGLIGNALLRQIQSQSARLLEEHEHEVKLIGLCNSKKMLFYFFGIAIQDYQNRLEAGTSFADISEFVEQMKSFNLPNSVFVDCTAADLVTTHYCGILQSSISIVTPNKKAQSASFRAFAELRRCSARRGVHFLYETSVGAGLPVISTLNDLLKSGDEIHRIEAVLSGTLSYIFNSFDEQ
ncbi:MAG: bifunctional aspartate kinase/homoserine dehydrogenase I, partial [Bdellovibrionales bacterium]|nr:bifunctional aspartate kinase/homoserine dehydrogenase I [Bdellovibrionales bacterium]